MRGPCFLLDATALRRGEFSASMLARARLGDEIVGLVDLLEPLAELEPNVQRAKATSCEMDDVGCRVRGVWCEIACHR